MTTSLLGKLGVTALAAFAIGAAAPTAKAGIAVDAEIALLMDVSGSVNATEFSLQQTGYVNAFNSVAVQNAIAATTNGIAVTLVQWSGVGQQTQSVGWTLIQNAAQASAFATAVGAMGRAYAGSTGLGDALIYGAGLFGIETGAADNGFDSLRQVIDVSGDGATNVGNASATGRNAALAAGVDVINGIAILGEAGLLTHYQTQVVGGTNADNSPAFVLTASSFADFTTAITQKLAAEVSGHGIPEPMTMAIFGIGLAGMGLAVRRRKTA